jgi:hypothetical protein
MAENEDFYMAVDTGPQSVLPVAPSALETDHHGTQAKIIPMRTDRSADPRRPWSRGAVLVTTPWVPSK